MILSFLSILCLLVGMAASCSVSSVEPLLAALFPSLGSNCATYVSLFSANATYYHQHDGFKINVGSQLLDNCRGYGQFCPPGSCSFQQNGAPFVVAGSGSKGQCHILAPYIWSEIPANKKVPNNLEPHTGFEYIIATPSSSAIGYSIHLFAEIETSYSVAFNWAKPEDTSSYNLTVQLLAKTASKGECDTPVSPLLTQFFASKETGTDLWRQQGSAVVLASGGMCFVAVPYAAQVAASLRTGYFLLTLKPSGSSYSTLATRDFPLSSSLS